MARTKRRPATEQPAAEPAVPVAAPAADDRTALDDLETRKGAQEQIPPGFQKRLPGGVTRQIRVIKDEIPKVNGKPYRVREPDGTETDYDELAIEGPSRMRGVVHQSDDGSGCHRTGVAMETDAPILVGKARRVRR